MTEVTSSALYAQVSQILFTVCWFDLGFWPKGPMCSLGGLCRNFQIASNSLIDDYDLSHLLCLICPSQLEFIYRNNLGFLAACRTDTQSALGISCLVCFLNSSTVLQLRCDLPVCENVNKNFRAHSITIRTRWGKGQKRQNSVHIVVEQCIQEGPKLPKQLDGIGLKLTAGSGVKNGLKLSDVIIIYRHSLSN